MTLLERIEAEQGEEHLDESTRLIRAGADHGVSLAERLSLQLHRIAWGGPLQRLRLRGRAPLKLITVPKDPIAGARAAGEAILGGRILYGHHAISLSKLDFQDDSLAEPLLDHLHSFTWLRDLAAAATRGKGAPLAEKLVQKWLDAHADELSLPAWRPDLWGRRILFWTAYAPYILSSSDAEYRAAVLKTLAKGARYLSKSADKAPVGLPRIAAWCGVVTTALIVQGGSSRLGRGEAGLARALGAVMHSDGGLVSRSPSAQVDLVALLGQLRAVYYAARTEMPEAVAEALVGSTRALLGVTLGDGALSGWQGSNALSRREVAAAVEGSGLEVKPLRQARGWGYQRLAARGTAIVLDAAPPPPSRVLTGGCASTLAFELSDGEHRLVVNCGGPGRDREALPDDLVQGLRTTAAHSTLTLADCNSTAINEDGTLGKGVVQVELSRRENDGAPSIAASHDGYFRRYGLVHRRQMQLSADGRELDGGDELLPKRRRRSRLPFAVRFHLGPNVEVTTTADGQGALLRIRGGGVWQFRAAGGELSVEESLWIDGVARPHGTQQLVIMGETGPDGATIGWQFRRAGK
jgi:uncharacterized heparinase superfamily protein